MRTTNKRQGLAQASVVAGCVDAVAEKFGVRPAAHAHFAPAVPDQDFPFNHQGRHGDGLAFVDVGELGVPKLLARAGVDRDGVAIERIEEDLAIVVAKAVRYDIAASNTGRRRVRLRRVGPNLVSCRGVEREHPVRLTPA